MKSQNFEHANVSIASKHKKFFNIILNRIILVQKKVTLSIVIVIITNVMAADLLILANVKAKSPIIIEVLSTKETTASGL
jgi:hypothetical protein